MAKAPRNKATTASYLILLRSDSILLGLRQNTGYQDGNYQTPAGHVDAGELPSEALIREAWEEIGIRLSPTHIRLSHVIFRPKTDDSGDRIDFFFVATQWEGEVTNMEPNKCAHLDWFALDELPENLTPHVRVAIDGVMGGRFFSELSLEYLRATGMYDFSQV